MKNRRLLVWGLMGAAVGAVLLGGGLAAWLLWAAASGNLLGVNDEAVHPRVTPEQQQTAARLTRLTFPPSTKYLYYHLEGFQDCHLRVKVEMPRADLPAFLASVPLRGAKFSTQDRPLFHSGKHFQPDSVTTFRSAEVQLSPFNYPLRVLIDDNNADTATVYLEYFEL